MFPRSEAQVAPIARQLGREQRDNLHQTNRRTEGP
jgi:hypothetical protein